MVNVRSEVQVGNKALELVLKVGDTLVLLMFIRCTFNVVEFSSDEHPFAVGESLLVLDDSDTC